MLTRRENLLVRPWQQRRFHHHRKKVESALPVVDVGPPPERGHVSCKLKQVQGEEERCAQIGRDNCALVLRLAHIMRTSRVDNAWRQPPPTFLRRVGIYLDPASVLPPPAPSPAPSSRPRPRTARAGRPSPASPVSPSASPPASPTTPTAAEDSGEEEESQDSEGRNLRCSACHPRTAWRRERRTREAVPALLPAAAATAVVRPLPPPPAPRPRAAPASAPAAAPRVGSLSLPLDQVVITYKALRLAISFPPHASVRIRSGKAGASPASGVSGVSASSGSEDLRLRPAGLRLASVKRTATSA